MVRWGDGFGDEAVQFTSHVGAVTERLRRWLGYMIYTLQATAVENAGETGVSCGTSTIHRGTAAQYVVGEI